MRSMEGPPGTSQRENSSNCRSSWFSLGEGGRWGVSHYRNHQILVYLRCGKKIWQADQQINRNIHMSVINLGQGRATQTPWQALNHKHRCSHTCTGMTNGSIIRLFFIYLLFHNQARTTDEICSPLRYRPKSARMKNKTQNEKMCSVGVQI